LNGALSFKEGLRELTTFETATCTKASGFVQAEKGGAIQWLLIGVGGAAMGQIGVIVGLSDHQTGGAPCLLAPTGKGVTARA